jgi:hypothetical protein
MRPEATIVYEASRILMKAFLELLMKAFKLIVYEALSY